MSGERLPHAMQRTVHLPLREGLRTLANAAQTAAHYAAHTAIKTIGGRGEGEWEGYAPLCLEFLMPISDNGPPRHTDGRIDRRYCIRLEFCGYAERRFVIRFCDTYVGNAPMRADANALARAHSSERRRNMLE